MFFTSLEGQVVSITVFFFLFGLSLYDSGHKKSAYFLSAIAFHWKIIGILLFPFYALKDLINLETISEITEEVRKYVIQIIIFVIPFVVFSIIPLLFSNYLFNSQFFTGFLYDVDPWNVLYLPLFLPSGILLAITMVFILITWYSHRDDWKKGVDYTFLLLLGFFFLFLYGYGMPWAWMFFIPGYLVIKEKELPRERELGHLLLIIFILGCFDFLNLTIGFDDISGLIQHFIERIFG
jgi:hypothetical protein